MKSVSIPSDRGEGGPRLRQAMGYGGGGILHRVLLERGRRAALWEAEMQHQRSTSTTLGHHLPVVPWLAGVPKSCFPPGEPQKTHRMCWWVCSWFSFEKRVSTDYRPKSFPVNLHHEGPLAQGIGATKVLPVLYTCLWCDVRLRVPIGFVQVQPGSNLQHLLARPFAAAQVSLGCTLVLLLSF